MKLVVESGLDHRKAAIAGLSFWIGVGFQNQVIFADLLGSTWGNLLGNGMTAGGLAAILLTAFLEWTGARKRRLEVELADRSLPEIDSFLQRFSAKIGWNEASTERLRAAGEETLAILVQQNGGEDGAGGGRLILNARVAEGAAELEFLASSAGENVEDRLAYLSEQPELVDEREISFRLLRHYASSVRHQKYNDMDIIAVRIESAS